jgi:hypothetical protein
MADAKTTMLLLPLYFCLLKPTEDKMASFDDNENLNWLKLPHYIQIFANLFEKYGNFQFDQRIYDYLHHETASQDVEELRRLSELFETHGDSINNWLDQYNMKMHPEARLVYFTRHLVGTACDLGMIS